VDRDGVEVESMARRPAGLPFLEVDVAGGGPATLAAALDVQAGLPAELVSQVRTIGATSPDGVWFTLSNGAKVVWGDSGDGDAKLDVFGDLVGAVPDAAVYDVSAPTAPATSQRRLRKPVVLATR
jgi:cell division protein FtsQ